MKARIDQIAALDLERKGIFLDVKREDILFPGIPGNKYRKLKYNLLRAQEEGHSTLLTFGGAYSNHIAATARAARDLGFKSIGVIRGAELKEKWHENPTLQKAALLGMQFKFVSRTDYRRKHDSDFHRELRQEFGHFYLLPEGGSNALAIQGCEEILNTNDSVYDYICCSVGTGGTLAGIANAAGHGQRVLGFPALKASSLKKDIRRFTSGTNWELLETYHFGGYAKTNESLIRFINGFYREHGIPLDPIYTAKMMYGIFDLISADFFTRGERILAIHTGGLQGIEGMNHKLKRKNRRLIEL